MRYDTPSTCSLYAYRIGLVMTAVMVFVFGCGSENDTEADTAISCSGVSLSYTSDAGPVIVASCAKSGCHGSGSTNGPGALLTYSQVFNARNEIYKAVQNGSMPRDTPLSSNEKSIILCWIENGASEN